MDDLALALGEQFNSIEIFAGAGGLALGLQQSGFQVRALVERDKWCCGTLQINAGRFFPRANIIRRDIKWLSSNAVLRRAGLHRSEIDLISGGPPCQSFSLSKIPKGGRSAHDPRDKFPWHFVRLVKKIKPKTFLLENVPGLLSKSDGRLFRRLLKSFQHSGYTTYYSVINAIDYGVPQKRRRLFLVGTLATDRVFSFPTPTHGPKSDKATPHLTIGEAIGSLSPNLPNQRIPRNTPEKRARIERIIPGSEWKHWRHRDRWDGHSRCLTAHCKDDWIHPLEPRSGTVRELATLQTFPLDFIFCGPFNSPNNSKLASQYRQVGNAVPVLLAKAIGKALISFLNEIPA